MELSLKRISPDFPRIKDIVDKSFDLTGGRLLLIAFVVKKFIGRMVMLNKSM